MKSYYEGNMEALKKKDEGVYRQVSDYRGENVDVVPETMEARDGNKILLASRDGKQHRFNSAYRPLDEAEKWVGQYDLKNLGVVVVMFGFGNGYFVRSIVKRLKNGDAILVYEPDVGVFKHVLENYDVRDLLAEGYVRILLGEDGLKQMHDNMNGLINWAKLKFLNHAKHPGYREVFKIDYKKFNRIVTDNVERHVVMRNTNVHQAPWLVANLANNLKFIPGSNIVEDMRGLWSAEVPAIIVSAGPSLNRNVEEIKRAKGKAVIFAADSALPTLRRYGIEPDVAVLVDARKSPRHFQNVGFEQMPLVCACGANKTITNRHEGRKFWINCHPYFGDKFRKLGKDLETYEAGGSVATVSFVVARILGLDKIILVGQDLAYDGEFTHSDNRTTHIMHEDAGVTQVEGIDGKPVKTRFDWMYYLKWFERKIEEEEGAITVVDATEGGAKIRGTVVTTLREAIDQYCHTPIDVMADVNALEPMFGTKELEQLATWLQNDVVDITYYKKAAKESAALCDRAIREFKVRRVATANMEQCAAKLSKINRKMVERDVYLLVQELVTGMRADLFSSIGEVEEDSYQYTLKTYNKQKEIVMAFKDAAEEIYPNLKVGKEEYIQVLREFVEG